MARVKVKLADNIARVVFVEADATIGATIGRDLKGPNGQVLTLAQLQDLFSVETTSPTTAAHRLLAGLELGDDHPQYLRKDTLTAQGDIYVRGATAPARLALGTNLQLLRSNGTTLVYATVSPTVTLTGNVTGAGTLTNLASVSFATTIAANAVTDARLRDSLGLSVIGRAGNTTGDPADIQATVDLTVLRRSGTTLGFGVLDSAYISDFAEAAQDAVLGIVGDSDTIDFSYDDATNTWSGTVVLMGLTEETSPAGTDFVMVWDVAASSMRRVQLDNLPGGGGGVSTIDIETEAGTSRTLSATDYAKKVRFTSGSAIAYEVPANATLAVPVGTVVGIQQVNAGQVTLTPEDGTVTILVPTGKDPITRANGAFVAIHKVGTNIWEATGDLQDS